MATSIDTSINETHNGSCSTMQQATLSLANLTTLSTPRDMPDASAPYMPLLIQGLSNINFADASFFDIDQYFEAKSGEKAAVSKYFQKEAQLISKMHDVLKEGWQLIYTLYSFRSCGRAIPPVQAHNQDSKEYLYRCTYEILRPEIGRMIQLMSFRDKFIIVFTEALASIIPDIRDREFFPSEAYLLMVAHVLDMVVSLDSMKNMKGSMNNDLSMYKRAISNFPKEQSESELMLLPKLAFFVAQQDQFATDVKKALATMSNTYEDIFHDMINICVDHVDSQHYLTPLTKHVYLRAMAFAVSLLDGDTDDRDFTKRKRFKIDKLGKLFKATPYVTLFGDIVTSLPSIYAKAPHLTNAKWESPEADEAGNIALFKAYRLSTGLQENRNQYKEILARAKVALVNAQLCKQHKAGHISADLAKSVYNATLAGLKMMSMFTIKINEQTAYKLLHPASRATNLDIPEDATSYELAVRYSYNSEDKRSLIEYIAMIKNMAGFFNSNICLIQECVDKTVFLEFQAFMRTNISQYYNSALKKKKPVATLLKYIRDSGIDGDVNGETPVKSGSNMDTETLRSDPISPSQLHFVRTIMDFIFNEKSKGMKGSIIKEKTFKDAQVNEMQKFFDESFYYLPMTNLSETIRECSDLSTLWFKEFYLELSRQVQFPISTSLPWILTEFILESSHADTIQYMFYPLDLYNDAAYRTLYHLKSRVIFDEIEAEVNLCFDQFMFKLGQRIFLHYKKLASMTLLPSDLKVEIDSNYRPEALFSNSYVYIMQQSNLELLGRSINVSKALSQSFSQYLRQSIDVAITRFESSDLLYISELDSLIKCARLTHELISKHIELERFEDIMAECDDSLSLSASNGRIMSHVIHELVNDFIPNFCYNSVTQRFMRSPVFYTQPIQRSHFPKTRPMYLFGSKALAAAYTAQHVIFKEFFGEPHFKCLLNLLTFTQIGFVASEITHHVELLIQHTMNPYIDAIYTRSPMQVRSPSVSASLAGTFEYYNREYKPLIAYGDLKSEVLQAFREIGNATVTIKSINDHISVYNSLAKVSMQEFVAAENGQKAYIDLLCDLETKLPFENMMFPLTPWCKGVLELTQTTSHSVEHLKRFVSQARSTLLQVSGNWEVGADHLLVNPKAFVHIWSGLEFVLCIPTLAGNDRVVRELFGDGLLWAGCLFLHILNQDVLYSGVSINTQLLSMAQSELGAGWPFGTLQQQGSNKPLDQINALDPDLKRYLEAAYFFSNVNETAFAILKAL
ncbi:hypothetical protein BDV3_000939 [Batrachochytrium dendrobatidis]